MENMTDPQYGLAGIAQGRMEALSENLFIFRDTCNVYAVRHGRDAVLVDFGSGAVLDHLYQAGIDQVTHVLVTHHHRDQVQGLPRAVEAGIQVWVPQTEQDLFHSVDACWQGRQVYNNYNTRQDRFSLLEPVRVDGLLVDYRTEEFAGRAFTILPTPGHTPGSLSLQVEVDGRRVLFSGDLIAGPGKVWSMAATQWTYNGAEGAAATVASLLDLKDRRPDVLLPSHGEPLQAPSPAIDLLVERLWELLHRRGENPRLFQLRQKPYEAITPHLLRHRASMANTYVLLSDSGKALFIDFGYDFCTGVAEGEDRASRRPWLYTLPALKEQFGVSQVEVVIPTHPHDDHVAGFNLLREAGTQVWAAESFADILENPARYNLPCLWYDPIPVDRRLPLDEPFIWQEYTLQLHPQPGHTRHAVAVDFVIDGLRVLATGDQFEQNDGLGWNYVYQNGYRVGDYASSAAMYNQIRPDLILPGHFPPLWVTPAYLKAVTETTAALEQLHADLLPECPNFQDGEVLASIYPYQAEGAAGEWMPFQVEVRSPYAQALPLSLQVIVPPGWLVHFPQQPPGSIGPYASVQAAFEVCAPAGVSQRRARIAVDVAFGERRTGQAAEALVSTVETGR